jgi:hypothetical protein
MADAHASKHHFWSLSSICKLATYQKFLYEMSWRVEWSQDGNLEEEFCLLSLETIINFPWASWLPSKVLTDKRSKVLTEKRFLCMLTLIHSWSYWRQVLCLISEMKPVHLWFLWHFAVYILATWLFLDVFRLPLACFHVIFLALSSELVDITAVFINLWRIISSHMCFCLPYYLMLLPVSDYSESSYKVHAVNESFHSTTFLAN